MANQQTILETEAVGSEEQPESLTTLTPLWVEHFQTAGIRVNRKKEFHPVFSDTEIQGLIDLFEKLAERGGPFTQGFRYFEAAEMIRERSTDQGFFTGTEIHTLIELLEKVVECGGPYRQMFPYYHGAELIRSRAKAEGF